MSIVRKGAYTKPKILLTIISCLGTKCSTLQNNPFISQTSAIKVVNILFKFVLIELYLRM